MARTVITPLKPVGPNPTLVAGQPVALALDIALSTIDNVNGNQVVASGNDLLVFFNPTGGALTLTITSAPDALGRSADITAYSIGIGFCSMFRVTPSTGWIQPDGNIYFTGSAATLKVAVIKLNP
jgi:hypothetical protein